MFDIKKSPDGKKCVWIGPTYHLPGSIYLKRNDQVDELFGVIQEAIKGKCSLVDSRKFILNPQPNDGLHFLARESAIWRNQTGLQTNLSLSSPAPLFDHSSGLGSR